MNIASRPPRPQAPPLSDAELRAWRRRLPDWPEADVRIHAAEMYRRRTDPRYLARLRRDYAKLCKLYPAHCKPLPAPTCSPTTPRITRNLPTRARMPLELRGAL